MSAYALLFVKRRTGGTATDGVTVSDGVDFKLDTP
jgi:hypothetical protein